jgi:hypothetical protein
VATSSYGGLEPAPRVTASARDSRYLGWGDVSLIRFGECEVKLHARKFTHNSALALEVWNMTIFNRNWNRNGNPYKSPASELLAVLFGVRS